MQNCNKYRKKLYVLFGSIRFYSKFYSGLYIWSIVPLQSTVGYIYNKMQLLMIKVHTRADNGSTGHGPMDQMSNIFFLDGLMGRGSKPLTL